MDREERIVSYPTDRVQLFDRNMVPLRELAPDEVYSRVRHEEINGEHSLTITTSRRMLEGWRALTVDGTGKWYEWVVTEVDENHASGKHAIGTYRLVWSLQYDLTYSHYHDYAETGMEFAATSQDACDFALLGQSKWVRGTCDADGVDAGSGCFSVYESCWERLSKVVDAFGCEVDATITVSSTGVVSRKLDLRAHVGSDEAKRRFDWGHDVASIRRTPDPGPYYCRVVPLGKGDTEYAGDDETSFEWPIDITEETGGVEYIEDSEAALAFRMADGHGGYVYPTKTVTYNTDDPEELLWLAEDDLHNHTRPNVTYEADVLQLAQAGMDVQGVALGDDVHIVDRGFNPDAALRLQGRVTSVEVVEHPGNGGMTLVIGALRRNMSYSVGEIIDSVEENRQSLDMLSNETTDVASRVDAMGTEAYLLDLLDRINAEIAANGGYTYLVPGEGAITYDVAVADPLIGSEATEVVQIKGGSIRIANSKKSSFAGIDDWNWRTVFTAGHIASEVVTAANIVTGFIGNYSTGTFWDLDNNRLRIGPSDTMGGRTVQDVLSDVDSTITGVEVEYAQNQSSTTAPTSGWSTTAPAWQSGYYIWQRTKTTTNNGSAYSTPTCISGRNGIDGTNGTDGADGADGVGIDSTTISYGVSQSGSTQPSSWQSSPPTLGNGDWLWVQTVQTYTDGSTKTTYTKSYVGMDGQNGQDGTSVTILGSYNTLAELQAAHPTGSVGDGYMVAGDLYVWNGSSWEDVGQIQGPPGQQGPAGADGTSVTVSSIQYGTSSSASTQPSSWSTTAPTSMTKGTWLWVMTTYSDSTTAVTKSYVGTDGDDGTSVYVQSATKVGDTTTVIIANSDGMTTTLTIVDGQDGNDGTDGANGLSGYVHTAWANSADGSQDFSTSVSANKMYLGVYTDNTAADSQTYSDYSWSLIKGADGADGADGTDGEDGVGITSIAEQYYLSTSDTTQTGGSWSSTPAPYESGCYYWTRSVITWDTDPVTTTTTAPILAVGINDANAVANSAQQDADSATLAAQEAQGTANDASDAAQAAQSTASDAASAASAAQQSASSTAALLDEETSARSGDISSLSTRLTQLAGEMGIIHDDLVEEIDEARRYATDYLDFVNGELIIGVSGTEIKNVIGATQQVYRTSAGDVAGYGLFDGIWEMFIETARIQNMLRFGNFAWIARSNGNMTVKWMGA